jgi:hypothetical protein
MLFATGIRYYKVEMIEEFIIICVLDCVPISLPTFLGCPQSVVKIGEKFIIIFLALLCLFVLYNHPIV